MKFLTTKEVCQLLKISIDTLHRWRRENKFIQPIKISGKNGKNLWLIEEVENFIKNNNF